MIRHNPKRFGGNRERALIGERCFNRFLEGAPVGRLKIILTASLHRGAEFSEEFLDLKSAALLDSLKAGEQADDFVGALAFIESLDAIVSISRESAKPGSSSRML